MKGLNIFLFTTMLFLSALPIKNCHAADQLHTTGDPVFLYAPESYPSDPTSDISWACGYSSVADIQCAFNNARTQENSQLDILLPMLSLPSQSEWDIMTDGEKALWLINRERIDRGVAPLQGVEQNVTDVAQTYAEYLCTNDASGHEADGRTPWQRLNDNAAIGDCHDFLAVAENLTYFASTTSIPLPVERAVYAGMYTDSGSAWGHRHTILWYPFNDNNCLPGMEGFLGIGRVSCENYQGPFGNPWPYAEIVVMNVFDPCSLWQPCDFQIPTLTEWGLIIFMTLMLGIGVLMIIRKRRIA